MEHPHSPVRRPRRRTALATLTALAIGAGATASAGGLHRPGPPAGASARTGTGPDGSLSAAEARLAPCRIAGAKGVQLSAGLATGDEYARSTGRIRALTLMIDFSDAQGEDPASHRYAEFFPQTTQWFTTSSYGRLDYRPERPIPGWLRMPRPFEAYGIERGSPFEPGYRKLLKDIAAAADDRVDFDRYDLVNVLVTPNAGPSALETVLSVTFSGNGDAPRADGVRLGNVSFVYSRQDDGSGSYRQTGFRVLPHENNHAFGLPDLYTPDGGGAAGHWDIMSEDWGANNDLLGWHKWKLGWLDDSQIACAPAPGRTEYRLQPLHRPKAQPGPPTRLVFVPLDDSTGYAVEVRTQGGNDEGVCRPGVLVYRVDANVDTGRGPVTVSDATPDSGGCTRLPNVHPELSDATYVEGGTFTDDDNGLRIEVLDADGDGQHTVRVTRR
ncbi:M6 family metalloprotease domain-containing protein [Streptomyces sp. NPDC060194]|uniref:M6 family metalloprotease domain-containing protein n=1 Tax=Streptomyces sp. NPDC060194 TaxID=3347069 RepID=UPI00365DE039